METTGEVQETMATDLGSLLDAGDGAIVEVVAGDTRLLAHKAVLTARSPVFAAMFRHNMLEASRGEVAIPDVEGPVLRQLLAYLYTLKAPQLPGIAPHLLAASDKYGVSVLKAECEKQLAAQLSVETALATALLAIRHSYVFLRQAAIAYMKTHASEVMATQGYTDAVRTQSKDFVELSRLLSETSAPAPSRGGTFPATQPHSDPASTATSHHSPPPDDAVSRLRRLSPREKGCRLIKAARNGVVGQLEVLLAAGADVEARDGWGRTGLYCAAMTGHEAAARRLLAAGAAVNVTGRLRWTPLHEAAYRGHAAVVQLLLAAGADHTAREQYGWTPLHYAALRGHTEAAAALLQGGAERGARDRWGKTPLDTAMENNWQLLVDLLQET